MAAQYPTAAGTDANLFVAVNNKSTTLSDNPLTIGATTVNVASTTGFPTAGYITIEAEAIAYTGVTGTSFTGCTRGADGTTAASHVTGLQVLHDVVAAHHNVLKDEIKAVEGDLVGVLAAITPVSPASTATSILNRWAQLAQQIINITGQANWYTAVTKNLTQLLPLSGGTLAGNLGFTTTSTQGVVGSTTNDSAAAGNVGEYVKSTASGVSMGSTAQFANCTSISLTAGDWDVSVGMTINQNTATFNGVCAVIASAYTGNTTTDHVLYDNFFYQNPPSTVSNFGGVFAPTTRISISSTTTIYLKGMCNYSAGAPLMSGRISARRVR